MAVGGLLDLAVGLFEQWAQHMGGVATGFEAAVEEDGEAQEVLWVRVGEQVSAQLAADQVLEGADGVGRVPIRYRYRLSFFWWVRETTRPFLMDRFRSKNSTAREGSWMVHLSLPKLFKSCLKLL